MIAKQQIGRLQDLLERVQMRAQQARANGTPASVAVEHDSFPPDTAHGGGHDAYLASGDAYLASGDDDDADVEVSSETVEVDIDIDEPMAMESGAQPVAQQTMPPGELEEEVDERSLETDPSMRPPLHEEVAQAAPPANEIEEPAPSSSRRPIAGEEPAETYGEGSAPRHTPPPESGKQVAAPSVHPVAVRASSHPSVNPSEPPSSLEGHTLIGGWREPGLGLVMPGVRVPVPAAGTPPAAAAPQASGARFTADVTRPDLAATANVARIEGVAPFATPTTLGELLDLSLAL